MREHRKREGLTQIEFAERMGKSQAWVSKIELHGLPGTYVSLQLIANEMHTTVSELLMNGR